MFGFRKKPFDPRDHANEQIVEALRSLGLKASQQQGFINCGMAGMKARCADVQVSGDGRVASLIVDLEVSPGVVASENVADMGENPQKAVSSAVFMWLMSVFTCAAAVHDPEGHPGHLAKTEDVTLADAEGVHRAWRLISSPAISFSHDGGDGESEQPPPTLPVFQPVIEHLARERGLHSFKVLVVSAGDSHNVECSINGAPAPQVAALFDDFGWQPQGAATLRQFHLLVPIDDGA